MILLCDECGMKCLVYTTKKLTTKQRADLNSLLNGMSFSFRADLQDEQLPDTLVRVVYKMCCNEPIEKQYYSANFDDICVYCASEEVDPWSNNERFYPQCEDCHREDQRYRILKQSIFSSPCNSYMVNNLLFQC